MAGTITSDFTTIDAADAITGWLVLGTWATAPLINADMNIQGTNAVVGRVSANEAWELASTAALDLTISNRHVFIWLKNVTWPASDVKANGGLRVCMSSDATPTLTGTAPNDGPTNSKNWFVGGKDTDSTTGWNCYVIDPTSTPTLTLGTPVMTGIQRVGMGCKILNTVGAGSFKPVNLMIDIVKYGTGLTITLGTSGSPVGFTDIFAADSTNANAWGVITKQSGIYYGSGKLNFGTTSQSAITYFQDTNQVLVYQDFPVAVTFYELVMAGASGFTTTVQFGTYSGGVASSGCTIKGSGNAVWTLTAGAANTTFNAYACIFSQMRRGTLNSTCAIRYCTISGSGELTPAGAVIDNCTFQSVQTSSPVSGTWALIFNATTDAAAVTNSKLISCNKAIKITAAGTYAFSNLTFSGNVYDIENNSVATQYAADTAVPTVSTNMFSGSIVGVGESFTGTGGTLSSTNVYLSKTGAPTGNLVAKVYAHSGTYGTSSIPTGAALAVSDNLDVSTLTGSLAQNAIQFSGTNNIALTNATNYVITVEYSGGNSTNYVSVGYETGNLWAGNYSTLTGSTWTADSTKDMGFFLYVGGIVVINATNGSNPGTFINTGNGSTTISNSVTITITVLDPTGAAVSGAQVAVIRSSDKVDLLNTTTNASGIAQTTFNYLADTAVIIRVRLDSTGGPRYFPYESTGTIKATGLSVTANMVLDTIAT